MKVKVTQFKLAIKHQQNKETKNAVQYEHVCWWLLCIFRLLSFWAYSPYIKYFWKLKFDFDSYFQLQSNRRLQNCFFFRKSSMCSQSLKKTTGWKISRNIIYYAPPSRPEGPRRCPDRGNAGDALVFLSLLWLLYAMGVYI